MAGRRGRDTHIAGIVSFIFWLLVKLIFADSRVWSGDNDEDDDDRYHIRRVWWTLIHSSPARCEVFKLRRGKSLTANRELAPLNEVMRRVYLPEKAKKKLDFKAEQINTLKCGSEVWRTCSICLLSAVARTSSSWSQRGESNPPHFLSITGSITVYNCLFIALTWLRYQHNFTSKAPA